MVNAFVDPIRAKCVPTMVVSDANRFYMLSFVFLYHSRVFILLIRRIIKGYTLEISSNGGIYKRPRSSPLQQNSSVSSNSFYIRPTIGRSLTPTIFTFFPDSQLELR